MSVGLLDTSVVIDLGRIDPAELPVELAITAITLGELSVGPLTASTVGERSRRLQVLQAVEHEFAQTIYPYDAAAARAFGEVMAAALQRGRTSQARASDFQIAAIAIANFWSGF